MTSPSGGNSQPLEPKEIRLLTIEAIGEPQVLKLTTQRHFLDDEPDFYAVSYVWGTAAASVTIECDGTPLLITPSAYEMLEHLQAYQKPLWIDAICIDQGNSEEKAAQIPLMRYIYAQATSVIIWLGLPNPWIQAFMRAFPQVYPVSMDWVPREPRPTDPNWRGGDWPNDRHDFWRGLSSLAHNDWFKRLWTYQEAVLAKRAAMVCGPEYIDALKFFTFVSKGFYTYNGYIRRYMMDDCGFPGNAERIRMTARACETIRCVRWSVQKHRTAVMMGNLLVRLFDLRYLQAKEHVDRVWAITGLLEEDLQTHLASAVNYSEQGRNEYWRSYMYFTKIVLTVGGSLDLLCWPLPLAQTNSQMPSWCPDLSRRIRCRMVLYYVWNRPLTYQRQRVAKLLFDEDDAAKCQQRRLAILDHPLKYVSVSEHDNLLRIRGFVLDTITEVVEDPRLFYQEEYMARFLWPRVWTTPGTVQAAALEFYDRGLALARRVAGVPHDDRTLPPSYLMSFFCDTRITPAAASAYHDTLACLTTQTPDGHNIYYGFDERRQILSDEALKMFRDLAGHSFFATSRGRFGIAGPGCWAGDKVCAFYGGEPLYVLRRRDDTTAAGSGSRMTEFCGVAFIPRLMEQYQRDAAKIGDDEVFVIA